MGRGRSGILLRIVDGVALVLTFCAVAALLAAFISPYIDPRKVWYFAFFGLFIPVIYIINVIFALYWACRWKPVFFLCAAVLLLNAGNVSSLYKFSFGKKYEASGDAKEEKAIKVMSFNVEGFLALDDNRKLRPSAGEIISFIKDVDPDILCFQEFQPTRMYTKSMIDSALGEWPYKRVVYAKVGIAIYSKFPIISSGSIDFKNSNNGVLYANIAANGDTLRVINNHLETTHVDRGNLEFLESPVSGNYLSNTKAELKSIGRRLKRSFQSRASQADSVVELIASENLTTIVCGDYNDTPVSYVYRTIRGDYQDAFDNKGEGRGYTYKRLYGMLRIDYILHSGDMQTLYYDSPHVQWSDHNPVISIVKQP